MEREKKKKKKKITRLRKKKKIQHTSAPEEKLHGLQPNQNVTVVLYCAGTLSVCAQACVCVWMCVLLINIQPEDRVPGLYPVVRDQQCGDDQWKVHVVPWVLAINFWSTFDIAPSQTSPLFPLSLLSFLISPPPLLFFFSSPNKSA